MWRHSPRGPLWPCLPDSPDSFYCIPTPRCWRIRARPGSPIGFSAVSNTDQPSRWLLLSSGTRDGLGWLPTPTCARAFPQNFLWPALEHMRHVITHPSRDVGALLARFGLSRGRLSASSEGSCRGSHGRSPFV